MVITKTKKALQAKLYELKCFVILKMSRPVTGGGPGFGVCTRQIRF